MQGCPSISFEVPYGIKYTPKETKTFEKDNSSQIIMKMARGNHVSDQVSNLYEVRQHEEAEIAAPFKKVKNEL